MSDPCLALAPSKTSGDVLIATTDLCKSFQVGDLQIDVLQNVNLRIHAGERVAILGQSGVGKSTLLYILGTLDHPTSGSLLFRGEDVFRKTSAELATFRNHELGFVFQFHHLLPEFSALENVMMPGLLRGLGFAEMSERAGAILEEVGLAHRLSHHVGKLSGGERQRVAVARALVLNPPLILADEPTGNLDPRTGEKIEDLLIEMNETRGIALVVVTHSDRLADKIGRRLTLCDGKF